MKNNIANIKETNFSEKNSFFQEKERFSPKEFLNKSRDFGISLKQDAIENIKTKIVDRIEINEKSDFSDTVNKYIKTPSELNIYQNANLTESVVNDRVILQTNEINPNIKDAMGRTNIERMERGLAPIDERGDSFNLHHIGQKMDSPLAELKQTEHTIYDSVLHDKNIKTEIHNDENENKWGIERANHWKERANDIKENN